MIIFKFHEKTSILKGGGGGGDRRRGNKPKIAVAETPKKNNTHIPTVRFRDFYLVLDPLGRRPNVRLVQTTTTQKKNKFCIYPFFFF